MYRILRHQLDPGNKLLQTFWKKLTLWPQIITVISLSSTIWDPLRQCASSESLRYHSIPNNYWLITVQFTSRDFLRLRKNGTFEHLKSSRRHSQSNSKAESTLKEVKKILRNYRASGSDSLLASFDHHNTPPASVQVSPAQRLFNRRSRKSPTNDGQFACTTSSFRQRALPSQARTVHTAASLVLQQRCCRSGSLEKRRCSKTKTISATQVRTAKRNCAKSTG